MIQLSAKILEKEEVACDHYRLALDAPLISKDAHPGQFVHVKITSQYMPLLRRPFSIHRMNPSGIEILFRVVGTGTRLLAEKRVGDVLDIIGPLGHGFKIKENTFTVILVAGGVGVAPLFALAERLRQFTEVKMLIGSKTKTGIICLEKLEALGIDVQVATDDGSLGIKGVATDLLEDFLVTAASPRLPIYGCGPMPMLKVLSEIAQLYSSPCQISLEADMACGVGACLGCVVKMVDRHSPVHFEYKRVCVDGPVFDAKEVLWR
ncbi:dihydroorotate dehydrogenase electron transfer subunit [Candidatus Desantisbacteria bacterium]|nr:dihydroorotate dehydrogenase electron transfer subunit [Candidatus Desantisbacteria bacterium]